MLGSHPFESDTEMSDIDDDDRETLFSSMDLLSPSGHSDAQTLAMMLQEQLDAINKEIRSDFSRHAAVSHCTMRSDWLTERSTDDDV